jgi:hypothetical protein
MESPHARAWRPDQGDANPLYARVVAIGAREHPQWGIYPVITLAAQDGVVSWHAWGKVAAQQLHQAQPEVGDLVAVEHLGRRTSGAGVEYVAWRVEVERAALPTPSVRRALGTGQEP